MDIQAVIFDMDGVLIDSEPHNLKQVNDFYQTYGVRAEEQFLISLVGSSLDYMAEKSIELLQKAWSIEEFFVHFGAYEEAHPVIYHDILNSGVKATLVGLKKQGYQIAIGSSAQMNNINRMLTECDLSNLFDVVFSGEMFAESKPNPEIYLRIAKQFQLEVNQCIVIEDSSFGIEAGKRAGMTTIALKDHRFGIDQRNADHFIETMDDLMTLIKAI